MDPITLGLLGLGGYFGYKKAFPWIKEKVATLSQRVHPVQHVPQGLSVQLDAGLNTAQLAEIGNLVHNVTNVNILRSASDLYKTQNFPLAASVLDSRARALGG
jgi:hypothetical protein